MRRQRGCSRWGFGALYWRFAPAAALALLVVLSPHACVAAPGVVEPVYWRQRVFFIPYQASTQDPLAARAEKVQLMVARDGSRNWELLESARPDVRGFSYHAPADGEYAFAVALTDRRGDIWPKGDPAPQLRVIVDTQLPMLQLAAAPDAAGQVVVRYEASDPQLRAETLRIEAQADGRDWQRLTLGPPEAGAPDRLLGQVAWKPPVIASNVRVRATIGDRAGNQTTATTAASLAAQSLAADAGPQLGPAFNATGGAARALLTHHSLPPRPSPLVLRQRRRQSRIPTPAPTT